MNLIDKISFEKLRLKDFIPEVQSLSNWEFMEELWIGDALGFTEWLRPMNRDNQTQSISLDLNDLDSEVAWRVFDVLGLELEKGMTKQEVIEEFGNPSRTLSYTKSRQNYEYLIGSGQNEYHLSLTIDENDGLVYVVMINNPSIIEKIKIENNSAQQNL